MRHEEARRAARRSGARPRPRTAATLERALPAIVSPSATTTVSSSVRGDRRPRAPRTSRPGSTSGARELPGSRSAASVAFSTTRSRWRRTGPAARARRASPGRRRRAGTPPSRRRRRRGTIAPHDGHLLPRRSRRQAGARVDQVVLLRAAAQPAALRSCRSSRGRLRRSAHGAAARQRDVDRPRVARSPPAETKPGAGEQRERVVDRQRLDDAVQVELHARGRARAAGRAAATPRQAAQRGPARRRVGVELVEVAVVAGRLDRGAERRVDEAVRSLARAASATSTIARELRRDEDAPPPAR